MKRVTSIFILLIMVLGLVLSCTACDINTTFPDEDKLSIVATIFPQYDFAREIAGDKANISMLVSPGTEIHSFEPTASDIMEISNCDVFICTGGESDTWVEDLLKNSGNDDMTVLYLMDCVDTLEADHDHGEDSHYHGTVDEHIWTSPINAIEICEEICTTLCLLDKENSQYYKDNLQSYTAKLTELDLSFRQVVEGAERNTIVFADRFPLLYFAEEYGLEYYAAFSGCSDDTEVSASTLATLIDKVKKDNIPVVLKIELSSDNIATTVAKETGAQIRTFYSCHNISKDDFQNGESYLSLMTKNVETLKVALS